MRKLKGSKIWIPAFLLAIVMAGCSDGDKRAGTGNPGDPLTPPTVTVVTPPNSTTPVCPNTAIVTATFSKPMNPATLTTSSFTLTTGGASVSGKVTYVAATMIATFTPDNSLAASSPFIATITTAAQDQFGNGLATNFVWMFTTSATCTSPAGPTLGAACSFGILGGSAVSSTGLSVVNGDVGVSPGTSISGFPPGTINGVRHQTDSIAAMAQGALTTAYNTAAGLPQGTSLPPDIGGLPRVFPPGVYTTVAQPSLGITGDLTLDPVGDPNAVWIFQISSTLTTASGKVIVLSPGKPGNVFWAIGSAATLGTGTTMVGNLMAKAAITLNTGVTLTGRALGVSASGANAGTISIDTSTITVPLPCQ
jgi:hypothetical protein